MRPAACKWRHRTGLLEPDIGIELVGEDSLEIVAQEFCFWPVDNPDGALEPGL